MKKCSIEEKVLEDMYKDYCGGLSLRELNKKYGTDRHVISFELKNKYNIIIINDKASHTSDKKDEIIELYKEGKSVDAICKIFSCGRYSVKNVLIKNNLLEYIPSDIDNKVVHYYTVENKSISWIAKTVHKAVGDVKWILEGNNIIVNSKPKKQYFDDSIFNKINGSEKAYWLGFLYADGYIHEGKHQLELTLASIDIGHINKFINFISGENITIIPKEIKLKEYNKIYTANRISLYSKVMTDSLVKLGCWQNKSLDKKAPLIDEIYFKDFIAGYFDGNGTCQISGVGHYRLSFCTGSEIFANFIHNNLKENNIHNTLTRGKEKRINTFTISIVNDSNTFKFIDMYYNNKELENTYMDRKKEQMFKFVS